LHVSGDSYGPLLWYLVLDLLRGRESVVLGKILAHFYLHFPTVKSWAMRPFARPAAFGEPP
jgi:hypothetical protein